jgi:hypothetical protein
MLLVESRSGLHVVLQEKTEATVQISNNSFDTLRNVTVQFGEKNPVQHIRDMGSFSTISISSKGDEYEFNKVIVYANDGAVQVVKNR